MKNIRAGVFFYQYIDDIVELTISSFTTYLRNEIFDS